MKSINPSRHDPEAGTSGSCWLRLRQQPSLSSGVAMANGGHHPRHGADVTFTKWLDRLSHATPRRPGRTWPES